jgi:haloalkane dehalogenase
VAFFETNRAPDVWSELGEGPRRERRTMRSPQGEQLILDQNFFIENRLHRRRAEPTQRGADGAVPGAVPDRESRRPVLQWARSLPLDGDPADVAERINAYGTWLAASPDVPKLLLTFDTSPRWGSPTRWPPGAPTTSPLTDRAPRPGWTPRHRRPAGAIGNAIARWTDRNKLR